MTKMTPVEQLSEALLIEQSIEKHGLGDFTIVLQGPGANAFAILANVMTGLRRQGWSDRAREKVQEEMTSGSYDHLVATARTLQQPRAHMRQLLVAIALSEVEEKLQNMDWRGIYE